MEKHEQRRRCLIAGGAGFVGSNLARTLLANGMMVDCVDDLSTGRLANVAELRRNPRFRLIKLDITDAERCSRLLRRHYVEVYHLACPTGVPNIETMGEKMLLASSAGTFNLLKIARRTGAKYLFASTAEAYGDPQVFPQPESYVGNVDPVGPRSAYEEAKRFGEAMSRFYGRKHGVDVRIVRIFNTFGPRMSPDDQRVIPQMLSSMINGQPVCIYGDGLQTRTFLHVSDLVAGVLTVMDRGLAGEVYNIGGARQITIRALFDLVKNVTGLEATAVFRDHFTTDHRGRWPDTSKIEALGWQQKVSTEQGVRETYEDLLSAMGPRISKREAATFDVTAVRNTRRADHPAGRALAHT